jgi:hypothetical protein
VYCIEINLSSQILRSVDRQSLCNPVNKANLLHNFSYYVCFFSLNVSGYCVPIIRRNNCIHVTFCTCHSVWMTVWYAGRIPDSHPYRITNTNCHINTVVPPDDGHTLELKSYSEIKDISSIKIWVCDFEGVYGVKLGIFLFGNTGLCLTAFMDTCELKCRLYSYSSCLWCELQKIPSVDTEWYR